MNYVNIEHILDNMVITGLSVGQHRFTNQSTIPVYSNMRYIEV